MNKPNLCNSEGECTSVIDDTECKYYDPCWCSYGCKKCAHGLFGESPEQCKCHAARAEAGATEVGE